MDKRHLWKRSNVYWVRVRVPDKVRHIIGSCQLAKISPLTVDLVTSICETD